MRNRIIALVFIITIFAMGGLTAFRSGLLPSWVKSVTSDFSKESIVSTEASMDSNIAFRLKWINFNGLFRKYMGVTADYQKKWYKLKNGTLMYSLPYQSDDRLLKYADNVRNLQNDLPEGTRLIYVQLPFKIKDNDMMPAGAKEYANDNADRLLKMLDSNKIETINVMKEMEKAGLHHDDLFYKTDHHWKPEAARWTACYISEYLSRDSDWLHDPSLYDESNYKVKHYDDLFLGSLGKKTGNWYAGTDDFDLLLPAFKTDFDFWADSRSGIIKRQGDFESALLDKRNLEKNYFGINTYATYTGGDFKENIVLNNLSDNHKKVLLLRDSFSCVFLPFLSLSCEQVTTLDLRHFTKMSVEEYINENHFDVVLIAYNPSAFSSKPFTFK